jgi:hypothetical protein
MSDNVFSLKAAVVIPLAQGAVHGALVALLTLAGCIWQSWPVVLALFAGVGVALLSFSLALGDWRRLAGYKAWPVVDTSGAGRVYEQEVQQPANLVRVELSQNGGKQVAFIDLPATHEQLQSLARGLLDGAPLSEAMWTGSGRTFTRAEFAALRAELIRRGLARWNSPGTPARGASLSPAGRAVCKRIVSGG